MNSTNDCKMPKAKSRGRMGAYQDLATDSVGGRVQLNNTNVALGTSLTS